MLRHLPNLICLVRIALVWPTCDALQAGDYWTALVLVAVCAVSDGLDGWLAKRFNWTSHLGKTLDPLLCRHHHFFERNVLLEALRLILCLNR